VALQFDPFDLDISVTPSSTLQTLAEHDYVKAIVMAFRLNERTLIRRIFEGYLSLILRLLSKISRLSILQG
jgi:periodic tryptophan protein 2